MAIEFHCPHCEKLLSTTDDRAAARAKCPACGELITVPSPGQQSGVPVGSFASTAAWSAPSTSAAFDSIRTPPPSLPPSPPASPAAPLQSSLGQRPCYYCGAPTTPMSAYCSACGAPQRDYSYGFRYPWYVQRVAACLIDLVVVSLVSLTLGWFWWRNTEGIFGLVYLIYYAGFESSAWSATLGKQLLGMRVVRGDGGGLSLPRAALRNFGKLLSMVILFVGFLMPLATARRQALHDLLADAVVIRN